MSEQIKADTARKFKKTPAGNIPADWEYCKLGKYTEEVSERNSALKDIPVLSVTNSKGFVNSEEYFDRQVYSKDLSNYKIIQENQFAYNPARVNVGSISLLKKFPAGLLSPMYVIFRAKSQLLPEYLWYWISSQRFNDLVKLGTQGSVRNSLNYSALEAFPFALPPRAEQEQIVRFLATVDNALVQTQQTLHQMQGVRLSIMREVFSRGCSEKQRKYHKTSIGQIPTTWRVSTIGDTCLVQTGATPLRNTREYFDKGDIPWVKTTDLNNSWITETEEKITETAIKETNCKKMPKGTVLVAMYGGFNQIGRTGILGMEAATNQAIASIQPQKEILPEFLNLFLNLHRIRWRIYAGSSRKDPNITKSNVEEFEVAVPPIDEQKKIISLFRLIGEYSEILMALAGQYDLVREGFMQALLSGKKRLVSEGEHEK